MNAKLAFVAALAMAQFTGLGLAQSGAEPARQTASEKTFRVLIFSKTAGFRHGSIPSGIECLKSLGEDNGYKADATEDSGVFTDEGLDPYRVVIFLNTTGDVLDDDQQAAFERYIQRGRGYVGIHAAADTEYDWPWYGELVGAYFKSHPRVQEAEIDVIDREHPATHHLASKWTRTDEWYDYHAAPKPGVRRLMMLDQSSYEGGKMEGDHPIAWCHEFDGGRAIYTGGGHTNEAFSEPGFKKHLAGCIAWAAGEAD